MYAYFVHYIRRYDDLSQFIFYILILLRLFNACKLCSTMQTRIAIAVFAVPNRLRSVAQARIVRQLAGQMHHQPIEINVLGGFLVLNYSLFGSVNVEQMKARCRIM